MLCSNRKKNAVEHPKVSSPLIADGTQAPPRFLKHHVAVAERRVRNPGEIPSVGKRPQLTRFPEKDRPDRRFRDVGGKKGGNGRDNDENVRRPRLEGSFCPLFE